MIKDETIATLTKERDDARWAADMHLKTVLTQQVIIKNQAERLAQFEGK